jgi:hypothetical protein
MLVLVLLAPVLVGPASAADQEAAGTLTTKVSRWESNLSAGVVLQDKIGIVKGLWWYPLPKVLALGFSFDFIGTAAPLSFMVSVNLPAPVVVPFVCAGAGMSLTRGGITHFGGGLKFRVWKKLGFIAEYRRYSRQPERLVDPPGITRARRDYIGAGIAYLY